MNWRPINAVVYTAISAVVLSMAVLSALGGQFAGAALLAVVGLPLVCSAIRDVLILKGASTKVVLRVMVAGLVLGFISTGVAGPVFLSFAAQAWAEGIRGSAVVFSLLGLGALVAAGFGVRSIFLIRAAWQEGQRMRSTPKDSNASQ